MSSADLHGEGVYERGTALGRKLVLLVEDNEADRDVYGSLLWYNGFDVVHAGEGEAALRLASELRPDLILLDIRLPGDLNGLDVARRLRERGFATPIVILSALSQRESGVAEDEYDLSGYIEKPVNPFGVVSEVIRQIGYARPSNGDQH